MRSLPETAHLLVLYLSTHLELTAVAKYNSLIESSLEINGYIDQSLHIGSLRWIDELFRLSLLYSVTCCRVAHVYTKRNLVQDLGKAKVRQGQGQTRLVVLIRLSTPYMYV